MKLTPLPEAKRYPTPRSGNIHAAAFNRKTDSVEIQFLNGSVYRYFRVPHSVYVGMRRSRSIGHYFNTHIKPFYPCEKLTYFDVEDVCRWVSTDRPVVRAKSKVTAT